MKEKTCSYCSKTYKRFENKDKIILSQEFKNQFCSVSCMCEKLSLPFRIYLSSENTWYVRSKFGLFFLWEDIRWYSTGITERKVQIYLDKQIKNGFMKEMTNLEGVFALLIATGKNPENLLDSYFVLDDGGEIREVKKKEDIDGKGI